MYFETNTIANHFDRLVYRVKNLRDSIDDLMNPNTNRGIAQTLAGSSDLMYNITRRVDEWIQNDELSKLCSQLEHYLDRTTLEGYLTYDLADQWWDDKGKEMLAAIFSQQMRTIIRGVDERDPMVRLVGEMAVKAAKRVLEYVCRISEYDLYSDKVGAFILDGLDAERLADAEERRKLRATNITKMDLMFDGTAWRAYLNNADDVAVRDESLNTASIMDARILAKALRTKIIAEQEGPLGKSICIKEYTKGGTYSKVL